MEEMMHYESKYSSDELMHYGVKGMHWGIRRYQPYPSGTSRSKMRRKAKRSLNYNDKLQAKALWNKHMSDSRAARFVNKAKKVKSSVKREKLMNKANAEAEDSKIWAKRIADGKNASQQIIREMGKQGFVTQKDFTTRQVDRGKSIASSLLGSFLGGALIGGAVVYTTQKSVDGTKYKVKDAQNMTQRQIEKVGQHNKKWKNISNISEREQGGKVNRESGALFNKPEAKLLNAVERKDAQRASNKGLYVAVTADEARKMGLDDSTRVTGKEEQEMWKALAEEYMKKQRR